MLLWLLLSALLCVSGTLRPHTLPRLPVEDGCLVASPEVGLFRAEGEAVILSFPFLHSALKARKMSVSGASVVVSTHNDSAHNSTEGRVLQQGAQLWLLPAQESDSGMYTCTYRTETFCVRGRLTLQVFSSPSVHMDKLSYSISVCEGDSLSFMCPSLSIFNQTERIHWNKVSGAEGPFGSTGGRLTIPAAHVDHSGLYMCRATVVLRQRPFSVSRALLVTVQENPPILLSDLTTPPDPAHATTEISPEAPSPVILSPANGTIFEHPYGSSVELLCTALADCPMAESTDVTWLVNGQSVEFSYLDGRALQGGRRVVRLRNACHVELRLMILEMRVKDTEAVLKCVVQNKHGRQEVDVRLKREDSTHTWLLFSGVALLCLLAVVSLFLCVLFRARRAKQDYALARQSSSMSDLS